LAIVTSTLKSYELNTSEKIQQQPLQEKQGKTMWDKGETHARKIANDWPAYAMELWGIHLENSDPDPERAGVLPEPLGYDTLNDGLREIGTNERLAVLRSLSRYEVSRIPSCTYEFISM
jgi:hypothetical protein